jgi:hypothetical protein
VVAEVDGRTAVEAGVARGPGHEVGVDDRLGEGRVLGEAAPAPRGWLAGRAPDEV